MRLIELKPRWVTLAQWASPSRFYVGMSFDCPHCLLIKECPTCKHKPDIKRLQVTFWPPIDPDNTMEKMMVKITDNGGHRRVGDTFDTITFTPSISFEQIGHWHGCIINGEVSSI
jgi:hypothetical protein